MTIPDSHPRLWWTPERLEQAKKWYHKNGFFPTLNIHDPNYIYDQLLTYMVTGRTSECKTAINWSLGKTISEGQLKGVASDNARWYGEEIILTYDWCHDVMTPEERQTLIDRWNTYFEVIRKKSWGGMGMPASNYFWGYWRNELEWGIATKGENPEFQTFLDSALKQRWEQVFVPYAAKGNGLGGIATEGSEYGSVMGSYATVPLVSAKLLGRNLFAETNWYKEAIYGLIYVTTPGESYRKGSPIPYYQFAPWADCCDNTSNYPAARNYYWGNTVRTLAMEYAGTTPGKHAREWLRLVQPTAYKHVLAVDPGGPSESFSSLPLDYYAPGPQFFSTRSAWNGKGAFAFFQVGAAIGAGHNHRDRGSFQFWCDGHWLSKESTGYAVQLRGYDGKPVSSSTSIPHNILFFGGEGISEGWEDGPPQVLRLESRPDYSYIAYDTTRTYRTHRSDYKGVHDNPYVKTAIREFVLVRALNALIVFDRAQSQSDIQRQDDRHKPMKPEEVVKTFLLHTENKPTIDGNVLTANSGKELLTAWTLVPENPTYRIVDEGDIPTPSRGYVYQFRTEIETSGAAESYFLHVLQGREAHEAELKITVGETPTAYTLELRDPKRGTAKVLFQKGMTSAGGEFGYALSGSPARKPLAAGIMSIRVDDSGPHWGDIP